MLYSRITMQDISVAIVQELLDRLKHIEKDTEHLYLDLGTIFPVIKAAIDESARNTDASIRTILAGYQHGVSAEQAKRRADDFIDDSRQFFDKLSVKEKAFFSIVDASIGELSQLDDIISRVRLDSEEMELVSLNAMTVALKSGHAGKAFSVITDELKRLSTRTILHANELSMVGSDLLVYLAQLREELGVLENDRLALFNAITAMLSEGFHQLDERVHATAAGFRRLSDTAATVRDPVARIMQGVQVQDIIRQSLDHVRLSLNVVLEDSGQNNARSESDNSSAGLNEEKAFLAEITRLSALLIEDIYGQVVRSLGDFESSINSIDTLVARVDEAKKQLLLSVRAGVEQSKLPALVSAYLRSKHRVSQTARHVADGVKRLDDRFNKVNMILSRFNNIVIASRIEIARNKALSLVANTVAGMMDLTERLGEDVSAAGALTRTFSKSINTEMFTYLGDDENADQQDFDFAMKALYDELARLDSSCKTLVEAAEDFQPFAANFFTAIGRSRSQTAQIKLLADELSGMQQSLATHATEIESELGITMQQTLSGSLELRNNRLREIVDRFTIFTHRQTASRIANLEEGVEDESEAAVSGEVTLF
ncbi:MAG: hypothetical protein KKC64_15120 [Spirochaetes bacterium]|nr:hypothetical protein [Spirochaetota bacterium]